MKTTTYGGLPVTGAGVTFGGIMLDQAWLLFVGFAVVALGITAVRLGWRRNRGVTEA